MQTTEATIVGLTQKGSAGRESANGCFCQFLDVFTGLPVPAQCWIKRGGCWWAEFSDREKATQQKVGRQAGGFQVCHCFKGEFQPV